MLKKSKKIKRLRKAIMTLMCSVKDDAKISLNIGFGLVSLVSQADDNSLVPSVTKLRKETSKRLALSCLALRQG